MALSPRTHGGLIMFKLFHGFLLLCMSATGPESATLPSSSTTLGNETDRLALLDFKKRITRDPLQIMSTWNDSIGFCMWAGVTCNQSTERVLILDLNSQRLVGSLSPSIGNLTYLTGINMRNNSFHGEIPQEMGRLRSLQYLNLSDNSFSGKIPSNISYCTQLRVLSLFNNELIGSVPDQLGSMLNLNHIWLQRNNLSGTIPGWIGNFSSLYSLYLVSNNFQGNIPNDLGRLTSLLEFAIGNNNISGVVPSSIYNITSIRAFSVEQNKLQGELPPNVGITLPNLQMFFGGVNKFTGNIPVSLSNASRLRMVDFAANGLTGTLPAENLGSLQSLARLNFNENRLGSGKAGDLNFISFLANCTSLAMLVLSKNQFGGELPGSIANLSTQLKYLYLGGNLIHGSIPIGIVNLVNLTLLDMENNYLGGSLPEEMGNLNQLVELYLDINKFSGPIPSSLGNMTLLAKLFMDHNRFEGRIPPSLGNCQHLLILDLSSNNLTSTIPQDLIRLSSPLIYLALSNNSLTGSLPSEVSNLVNLGELYVSRNKLSGEIPETLGSCTSLVILDMDANEFEGTIPQSLKNLRSLEEIHLSCNNLSGYIPEFLGKLTFLKYLNLSHNDFEGELPKEGIFSNASGLSILGNDRLCGGIPQLLLPPCSSIKRHSSRGLLSRKVVIPVGCAIAVIVTLSCFIVARSKQKNQRGIPVTSGFRKDWKSGVSYSELAESTDGFSVDNLIGSGSFGFVYKGVLPSNGMVVAVKVLNLQQKGASKSFIHECKLLRSIRHRNLLKIITACSGIDNQGNDFKCLVFEYMENGSLDVLLHPKDDEQSQSKTLSLIQRLDIAIDVASALDYLHNDCETSIIHCDLKPSNVLLDEDMVSHVGDFGLARFLLEASDNRSQSQTMSAGLKGSIGYIPPEYGMGGQVSVLGDIYSFGILLLEMFTGQRPTDEMFGDGLNIHQFTAMAMPDRIMDIIDPSLAIEREGADPDGDISSNDIKKKPVAVYQDGGPVEGRRSEECMVSVMQIGLSCSTVSPGERMPIGVVVNKMKAIRESYLKLGGIGKQG